MPDKIKWNIFLENFLILFLNRQISNLVNDWEFSTPPQLTFLKSTFTLKKSFINQSTERKIPAVSFKFQNLIFIMVYHSCLQNRNLIFILFYPHTLVRLPPLMHMSWKSRGRGPSGFYQNYWYRVRVLWNNPRDFLF